MKEELIELKSIIVNIIYVLFPKLYNWYKIDHPRKIRIRRTKKIKSSADDCYKKLEYYSLKLKTIQENCSHNNKYIGLYSWKIGCTDPAELCSDCGAFIKWINNYNKNLN